MLAAWDIDTGGKPVFVGLDTAATESGDAWAGFLTDLGERGLTCPLLVVSDGAPGLIAAAEQTMSAALRQRCLIHRARNILAKVPTNALGEVQADYWAIFNLPDTVEPGLDAVALVHKRIDQVAMRWRDSYPAAVRCLLADRDSLTVYLRFPREHWPRVRHSNFIERTFGETRRRVKVIGRLPGEHSVTSLVWAVLDRASTGWRGFTMTAAGLRLLHDLRRTLLQPPAQLRSRGEPTPPPSPAAPSPRPRRSAVPEAPWRDASVTPTCPVCQGPLPTGRARAWCSPRCRQAAYRTRHRPPSPTLTLPPTGWVTDRQRRLRMPRLRGTPRRRTSLR